MECWVERRFFKCLFNFTTDFLQSHCTAGFRHALERYARGQYRLDRFEIRIFPKAVGNQHPHNLKALLCPRAFKISGNSTFVMKFELRKCRLTRRTATAAFFKRTVMRPRQSSPGFMSLSLNGFSPPYFLRGAAIMSSSVSHLSSL